jgi:hypothetical protein
MARQRQSVIEFAPLGEKPKPKLVKSTKANKSLKTESAYVDLPEDALYGYLGDVARSLEGPLGWCYSACLGIYAGMNSTCIADDNPESRSRANLYVALLGPSGHGKSVAIERAIRTLKPNEEQCETDTPASDKGVYKLFAVDPDQPPYLRSTTLALDEMRDMMGKIAINNSSLGPVLCKLFGQDRAGSWDAKGGNRVQVRLSIVGGLKTEDISDFQSVFGANTTDGLYTRFIFVPPPERKFSWDFNWVPTMNPPPIHTKVTVSPECRSRAQQWELEYEAIGYEPTRIAEIALRVAVIAAAANGDTSVSDECMDAALRFASWQAEVKYGYRPGVAKNIEAELSADMLRSMKAYGLDAEGKPVKLLFSQFVRKRNWYRKHNPTTVRRVKYSLGQLGAIVIERTNNGTEEYPRFEDTGYVWLSQDEFK